MDEDRDIDKKPDVENVEDKEIEEEAKEEEEEEEEPQEEEEEEVEQVRVQVSIPRFSNTRNLDVLDSVRGYSRHEGLPTSSRDLHSVRLVELPHPGVIVDFI